MINGNGYRVFSNSDLIKLKEITLYRKLNLSIHEIHQVMSSNNKNVELSKIRQMKYSQAKAALCRAKYIDLLIDGKDYRIIAKELEALEMYSTIKEKLLLAFPGYIGHYLSISFGKYLSEPIITDEQKVLCNQIIDFFEEMEPIEIPEELEKYINENERLFDEETLESISRKVEDAYENFELYWDTNKESILEYVDYKKTPEFQESIIPMFLEAFQNICNSSGYYDVFIPNMRKLSPSYDSYYKSMLCLNKKLSKKLLIEGHKDIFEDLMDCINRKS